MGLSEIIFIACLIALFLSYRKLPFIGSYLANTIKGFKEGLKEEKRPEKDITPPKKEG